MKNYQKQAIKVTNSNKSKNFNADSRFNNISERTKQNRFLPYGKPSGPLSRSRLASIESPGRARQNNPIKEGNNDEGKKKNIENSAEVKESARKKKKKNVNQTKSGKNKLKRKAQKLKTEIQESKLSLNPDSNSGSSSSSAFISDSSSFSASSTTASQTLNSNSPDFNEEDGLASLIAAIQIKDSPLADVGPNAFLGYPEKQYKMAQEHLRLDNIKQATIWFKAAADQGHKEAKSELEKINGLDLKHNRVQDTGSSSADDRETLYQKGKAEKNDIVALALFKAAAEKGHVEAQFSVGQLYLNKIINKPLQAIEWYKEAAKNGHEKARHELAACGIKFDKDQKTPGLQNTGAKQPIPLPANYQSQNRYTWVCSLSSSSSSSSQEIVSTPKKSENPSLILQ